jgi:hypothetical protein
MNKIILDKPTLQRFGDLGHVAELCDEFGQTIGYFRPIDRSEYNGVEPPISDEELRQRESELGGFTTAEVLAHLDSLARRGNG